MLSELFRSRLRAKVLGWLFAHPDQSYFVRQLEAILGEDSTNLSRELARLEGIGLLISKADGRQKYYQANAKCPIFQELRGIAVKTTGLADVLRAELAPLADEIQSAFVYGSQAGGKARTSSDIDLFVVGDVDELALHRAVAKAEEKLRRPVHYTLVSTREFRRRRRERGGFLQRVLNGPRIPLIGDADEIRRASQVGTDS